MTKPQVRIRQLFSAPVLQFIWQDCEELNQSLKTLFFEKREELPAERMSNAGGWQSPKTLQTWEAPCVSELIKKIDLAVLLLISEYLPQEEIATLKRWHVAAWANINEQGDYNMLHNHAGGMWSGVYYVDAGTTDAQHPFSGVLTFRNPTLAALAVDNLRVPEQLRKLFRSEYSISPKTGLMLLFPSWLEHMVHPYFGSTPRISVSWDVIF
jgi:uncharacterized protein (TIGR02466 family)